MTKKREKALRARGYKLKVIWEHQFHLQVNKNKDMFNFVNGLDIQERLDPRNSFLEEGQTQPNYTTKPAQTKPSNTMTSQACTLGQINIVDILLDILQS